MKDTNMKPLSIAGILLGIGLGGFIDGIVFHQIFQFHNMLSNRYFPDTLANEQLNMFWDGIFHAFTWIITVWGVAQLWKVAKQGITPLSTGYLIGSMTLGWGLFNFIEGLIDHQILEVHHVLQRATPKTQTLADLTFLLFAAALITTGLYVRRISLPKTTPQRKPPQRQHFTPIET